MSEHARLSFSASERWLRCPASIQMTQNLPDRADSPASQEGTFAHKVMEDTFAEWHILGEDPVVKPITFPDDLDTRSWEPPAAMQAHLQKCVDYIVSEFENFPGDNVRISLERKVDMHYLTGRDDTWGTCDVKIESDEYLSVYDLKYGKGIFVEPDTSQNRMYLLGSMCDTLKKTRGVAPWELCYGMIMQPRYLDADGEFVRGVEIEPDELLDWFDEVVKPAIGLTDDPPEPVAGEKQCRFCAAKPTCPAAQKVVQDVCSVFEPVSPGTMIPLPPEDAEISDEDLEKLIEIHDNTPFINGYLESVGERIRKLLEARDPRLDGRLKLVVSRRTTSYSVDENEVIEALAAGKGRTVSDGYIPRKKFVKEAPLTASQMLKLKLNDAQKARLQELVKKSEGSLTIVPWSDTRDNANPAIPFEDQTGKVASEQPSGEYDFL